MPRTLLDKPKHKIDLGLFYNNKKSKMRLSLWADYYLNMLDSNSVTGGANYMNMDSDLQGGYIFQNSFAKAENQMYEKKTFGLWHLMVQKEFGRDNLLYFGIDNLFNHRDDDRALAERTYRLGVNFKFDTVGGTENKQKATDKKDTKNRDTLAKKDKSHLFFDYEISFVNHGGTNRPPLKITEESSVGSATKNMLDKKNHQFEQTLRLYLDSQLQQNFKISLGLSISGKKNPSPKEDLALKKGLNYIRINELNVTYNQGKNAYSLGRLKEKLGATSYYFAEYYDGLRAVLKNTNTELRLGYGSFKQTTGIDDSFYTHITQKTFYRPPTVAEFTGLHRSTLGTTNGDPCPVDPKYQNGTINFYQQLMESAKKGEAPEKQLALIEKMYAIATKAYGKNLLKTTYIATNDDELAFTPPTFSYKYIDDYGQEQEKQMTAWDVETGLLEKMESPIPSWAPKDYQDQIKRENEIIRKENKKIQVLKKKFIISKTDCSDILKEGGHKALKTWWHKNNQDIRAALEIAAKNNAKDNFLEFKEIKTNDEEMYNSLYEENFVKPSLNNALSSKYKFSKVVTEYYNAIQKQLSETEYMSLMPREALGKITGYLIKTQGKVLEKDTISPLERAFYLELSHHLTPSLKVSAFHLNSHKNPTTTFIHANENHNDTYNYKKLANVLSFGIKYQLVENINLTADYGRNLTDYARHLNGTTIYEKQGEDKFIQKGYQMGKIPTFYALRLTLGKNELLEKGDFSAFFDYKYFEHGSFFGGNGTDYLPDRYIDGIKSFSFGVNYAMNKNLHLAFTHTFDAKGIKKRDTLYGGENFNVPNFTRVKLAYKF